MPTHNSARLTGIALFHRWACGTIHAAAVTDGALIYLGERDIKSADGSTAGMSAILQRAFVNRAGQIPG